jgi:hypothetical protein
LSQSAPGCATRGRRYWRRAGNENAGFRRRFAVLRGGLRLALAGLEAGVRLADHEDLAPAAHDLAVAMAGLGRLEGIEDFHDFSWERGDKEREV